MVERPTCNGRRRLARRPPHTPRKKFGFDSMVDVAAPSGRFKYAQTPPGCRRPLSATAVGDRCRRPLSATAISAPPWRIPPVVQRSGAQASVPTTCEGSAFCNCRPRAALKASGRGGLEEGPAAGQKRRRTRFVSDRSAAGSCKVVGSHPRGPLRSLLAACPTVRNGYNRTATRLAGGLGHGRLSLLQALTAIGRCVAGDGG